MQPYRANQINERISLDQDTQLEHELKKIETDFTNKIGWHDQPFQKFIDTQKPFLVIAKYEEEAVGAALFNNESSSLPKNTVYLDHLAVRPSAQGKGIGRFLIFSAFKLSDLGIYPSITQILLHTGGWNKKSQTVYEKLGFKAQCYYNDEDKPQRIDYAYKRDNK